MPNDPLHFLNTHTFSSFDELGDFVSETYFDLLDTLPPDTPSIVGTFVDLLTTVVVEDDGDRYELTVLNIFDNHVVWTASSISSEAEAIVATGNVDRDSDDTCRIIFTK